MVNSIGFKIMATANNVTYKKKLLSQMTKWHPEVVLQHVNGELVRTAE